MHVHFLSAKENALSLKIVFFPNLKLFGRKKSKRVETIFRMISRSLLKSFSTFFCQQKFVLKALHLTLIVSCDGMNKERETERGDRERKRKSRLLTFFK